MQTVKIIAMGKLKERYLTEGCEEYQKRLRLYCKPQLIELEPAKLPPSPSVLQIEKALSEEGGRLLQKAEPGAIIALCVEGEELTSPQLASYLQALANEGGSTVSFVIGSSFGLSSEVKERAVLRLSMSRMTFPHQLARLLLTEQLYRAYSISAGGKYHK